LGITFLRSVLLLEQDSLLGLNDEHGENKIK